MDPVFGCFAALDSPVDWRPFGRDAFTDAEHAGTLIFLFIGAAWCADSQRFLHDLPSDSAAVAELNESYIPILVDGEGRPDVQQRYPAAGWPGLLILEPGGEVLWASTQVPPGQLGRLLAKVRDYFNQNRRDVRAKAQVSRTEQREAVQPAVLQDSAPLSGAVVTDIATATITAYDADNGGFAMEAGYSGSKFPHLDAIAFLLSLGGEGGAATIVQESLEALLTRGLWDPEGGGLRRYAAERDWSGVHGEKLLLDNARLLGVLCRAGHQLQSDELLAHARDVLEWCRRELGPDAPRFRASLRPPHEEVPADWAVPLADDRVFTGPHAVMAAALFASGRALDDADAVDQATAILDLIWEEGREDRGRLRHQLADPAPGTLSDHAEVAAAFLDAFEATGQRRFLERGEIVFEVATKHFRRPGAAFFDVIDDRDAVGRCRFRQRQAASNAGIALVALRLHALTRTDWYRDTGMEALAEFAGSAHKQGLFASRYAMAILRYREPAPVAIIVGAALAPPAQALHAAALRLPISGLQVQWLDPLKDMETLTRFTVPQSRDARAYLCRGTEVLGPWRRPEEMAEADLAPAA